LQLGWRRLLRRRLLRIGCRLLELHGCNQRGSRACGRTVILRLNARDTQTSGYRNSDQDFHCGRYCARMANRIEGSCGKDIGVKRNAPSSESVSQPPCGHRRRGERPRPG
jgi:hypothetical protein